MEKIFGEKGLLAKHFTNYEYRLEQIKMSEAVEEALREERSLIVEAGTGTGKTLAYLVPAIFSRKKVVISTGTKNLQEQLFSKDIPLMQKCLPIKFSVAYMKGRNNYLCLHRFAQFMRNPMFKYAEEINLFGEIEDWAGITEAGDRAELEDLPDNCSVWTDICSKSELCLGQKCKYYKKCFITKMKQRAAKANIIIVNHHLFFADLALKGSSFGEVIPRYEAIIFDEAHQLEDTATNYFGVMVSNYRLLELIRDTQRELSIAKIKNKKLSQILDNLHKKSETFFKQFSYKENKFLLHKKTDEIQHKKSFELTNSLELLSVTLIGLKTDIDEIQACARRSSEIKNELEFILQMADPAYVYWCERRGKGVFLQASSLDISKELKKTLFDENKTVILTSATLSTNKNFEFIKNRLGIIAPMELILESHFDYKSQAVIYLPKNLPEPNSSYFSEAVSKEIKKILKISKGRAFILFTSYKNMDKVYDNLVSQLSYTMLKQGNKPKSVLLNKFKKDIHSVLFATSSFWSGVDVQGEALSCVIVDKLPFATPSEPVIQARIEYISQMGGNPFFDYQIPMAVISLKQGLGRLIRNNKDRGVLSILDIRLLTKSYGKIFLNSLPPCSITKDLEEASKIFKSYARKG